METQKPEYIKIDSHPVSIVSPLLNGHVCQCGPYKAVHLLAPEGPM